ncbi:uncharacterized protein METZ01_LOCUS255820, partial [marine metagenome]
VEVNGYKIGPGMRLRDASLEGAD